MCLGDPARLAVWIAEMKAFCPQPDEQNHGKKGDEQSQNRFQPVRQLYPYQNFISQPGGRNHDQTASQHAGEQNETTGICF